MAFIDVILYSISGLLASAVGASLNQNSITSTILSYGCFGGFVAGLSCVSMIGSANILIRVFRATAVFQTSNRVLQLLRIPLLWLLLWLITLSIPFVVPLCVVDSLSQKVLGHSTDACLLSWMLKLTIAPAPDALLAASAAAAAPLLPGSLDLWLNCEPVLEFFNAVKWLTMCRAAQRDPAIYSPTRGREPRHPYLHCGASLLV